MIKIPMGFKGPKGQLQQLFTEETLYKATQLLLNDQLIKWQHKESLELVTAMIEDESGIYKLSIGWPLSKEVDEVIGSCHCELPAPCIHLAALVIASKAKIDQLPPFTQQLQASRNIAETFSNWMNKQIHDPYPNMARHRLIYLLDYDEVNKSYHVALHKAYISTEGRYSLKAPLDSNLLHNNPLPKFVTIADQSILQLMLNNSLIKQHQFSLKPDRDGELFHQILLTGRCFWKAVYRSPLEYDQNVSIINPNSLFIFKNFYLSINENAIATKSATFSQPVAIDVCKTPIIPHLKISSHEKAVHSVKQHYYEIDVANISFFHQSREFTFADLSSGKIVPETQLLNQMAGYLRQIENLDSLYAHFEKIIISDFHLNDRHLDKQFSQYACLLFGLKLDGWKVTIDDSFRMNQTQISDWYVNIKNQQANKQKHSNLSNNWFDLELGVTIDGESINILPHLVKAIQSGKLLNSKQQSFNIKLEDGANIGLNNDMLKQIVSTLSELYDSNSLNVNNNLTMSSSQLMRINQLNDVFINKAHHDKKMPEPVNLKWQGDAWLKKKAKELDQGVGLQIIATPKNLTVALREYQRTGFAWLQFLSNHGLGGILADDMGLGKTLQVLTHILHEKNSGQLKSPCLIVVPTSLLSNWQSEIKKFAPSLSSLVLSGQNRKNQYKLINEIDIIIISYGVMIRDQKQLTEFHFHLHVLDEAQAIKNAKTRAAKVASSINSSQRLCLSGTPIENHLGELWSLFNFLMPGFLGSQKQFEHIYQIPIEKAGDSDRQKDLSQRVAPFMLRRTKTKVAKELPDKTEIIQIIELNEKQANLYETIRLTMSDEIKNAMNKSQSNNDGGQNKIIIGNALLRLRQVCCHPALLKLESVANLQDSAKLNWLSTVLPNMIEEGNRILLFSSFTSMLDIIEQHLIHLGIESLKLTGKTPSNKRGEIVDKFQAGNYPVFLISLKAGGSGLNLTTADTVIHFDPWWNPAAESQASDRAHRIGQDKNVFVYKLITKGTVEQKIQKLQMQKSHLAQGIFDAQGNMTTLLKDGQWQEFLKPIDA